MFRLIAKSSELPKRCRTISNRLLAQLDCGKLKGATQNDAEYDVIVQLPCAHGRPEP